MTAGPARLPGAGIPGSGFSRPTDVAWDHAGNIYVADGNGANDRIAKFDKDGRFISHWGSTGKGPGQFDGIKALAIDAQGNVYAADLGNKRIQVFDGAGKVTEVYGRKVRDDLRAGTPARRCGARHAASDIHNAHAFYWRISIK